MQFPISVGRWQIHPQCLYLLSPVIMLNFLRFGLLSLAQLLNVFAIENVLDLDTRFSSIHMSRDLQYRDERTLDIHAAWYPPLPDLA